jgi:hypothetical protein
MLTDSINSSGAISLHGKGPRGMWHLLCHKQGKLACRHVDAMAATAAAHAPAWSGVLWQLLVRIRGKRACRHVDAMAATSAAPYHCMARAPGACGTSCATNKASLHAGMLPPWQQQQRRHITAWQAPPGHVAPLVPQTRQACMQAC